MTDTNQASEDRLDTDTQIMHKIDYILYSEHEQPFSKGDALLMLIRNQIEAHVRTEKLKLLAEVRERAIPSPTTPAGENEFVPLKALTKLEAEL
jgi:hypothetical protein